MSTCIVTKDPNDLACLDCHCKLVLLPNYSTIRCPTCGEQWVYSTLFPKRNPIGTAVLSVQAQATNRPYPNLLPVVRAYIGPGEAIYYRGNWVCKCTGPGSAYSLGSLPRLVLSVNGSYDLCCLSCPSCYTATSLAAAKPPYVPPSPPAPVPSAPCVYVQATTGPGEAIYYRSNWVCNCARDAIGRLNPSTLTPLTAVMNSVTHYADGRCVHCQSFYEAQELNKALHPPQPPAPTTGIQFSSSPQGAPFTAPIILGSSFVAPDDTFPLWQEPPEDSVPEKPYCFDCKRELCPELDQYYGTDEYFGNFCKPCRSNRGIR